MTQHQSVGQGAVGRRKFLGAIATTGVRSHDWELKDEKIKQQSDLDVETKMKEAVARKLEETRNACRICGFDDVRRWRKELDQVDEPMGNMMARRSEMIPAFMPLPEDMGFSSDHRIPPEKYND